MTEKLGAMSPPSGKSSAGPAEDSSAGRPDPGGLPARRPRDSGAGTLEDQELARKLNRHARASGMARTRPGGLLKSVTKPVIETTLEDAESRSPGLRPARRRGPQSGQLLQLQADQGGPDRRCGRRGDWGPEGSEGHVRADDRPASASAGGRSLTRSC